MALLYSHCHRNLSLSSPKIWYWGRQSTDWGRDWSVRNWRLTDKRFVSVCLLVNHRHHECGYVWLVLLMMWVVYIWRFMVVCWYILYKALTIIMMQSCPQCTEADITTIENTFSLDQKDFDAHQLEEPKAYELCEAKQSSGNGVSVNSYISFWHCMNW